MAVFKGHPKDGHRRFDYISRKIDHMRRLGLSVNKSYSGFGMHGGAAPDWLIDEQKAAMKALMKARGASND
jgi:hypothetical protein